MGLPHKAVIRVIIFLLGLYEFGRLAALFFISNDPNAILRGDSTLFNAELLIQEKPALYLSYFLNFVLGLNRLTWVLNIHFYPKQNHFWSWINLVLTHSAELLLFLSVLVLPHFNVNNETNLLNLYQQAVKMEVGNKGSRDILVVVPLLLLLSILHGPKP